MYGDPRGDELHEQRKEKKSTLSFFQDRFMAGIWHDYTGTKIVLVNSCLNW